MVPELQVILNAPAVFRFGTANPDHLTAAGAGRRRLTLHRDDAGRILADRIAWFMQQLDVPNGFRAVGYTSADIPRWWKARCHSTTRRLAASRRPDDWRCCSRRDAGV